MFSDLAEFIDNQTVAGTEDKELIKVNTRMSKAKYYDPEEFMNAVFNYIINKLNSSDDLTDFENNLQVIKALNVIYLDGDWTFPKDLKPGKFEDSATELMTYYYEQWEAELRLNNFTDFYYFQFIPKTFPNRKAGFHVLIYVSENITQEKRMEMYQNVKRKIIDSGKLVELKGIFSFNKGENPDQMLSSNTFYEKLFDPQPLKSCQCLIPFAQKDKAARRYKLHDTTFDADELPEYFVIPIQHKEYEQINTEELITNEAKVYDDSNDNLDELLAKLRVENQTSFNCLGRVGKLAAKFMMSLRYLSPNHVFWERLSDHDTKLKTITRDLIGFILINYFIEKNGERPPNGQGQFFEAIARILHPLLQMTTINKNDTQTERDKFSSLYKNIREYYSKYTDLNDKDGLFCDELKFFWQYYTTLSARKKHELDAAEREMLGRIKYYFQKYYSNWFRFLTETVLAGLTDEIRPFKEAHDLAEDPRANVVFDEVMREQPNVNTKAKLEDSFYIKTLRLWCRMFIVEGIYDTKSIQETIRSILTAFCRYYIWYSKATNGNVRIFIYNIRQTKSLCDYPYNQWIRDSDDGDMLKDWIKTIYLAFIKPELLTINISTGIKPILENLKAAELVDGVMFERMIKPLTNFDKDMETAYRNIISSFAQERFKPPVELNATRSEWFPMRNGLLKFNDDGSVRMSYDNHEHFMAVYSNVIYDENYDYECEEFKKVKKMWEQTFPIKEERDYNLSLFASALNGKILKDMLIIQYGSGGDGKTVSDNAILGMLGSDGFNAYSRIEENGKASYVQNPCGMGTTMKTETLLTSLKGSHDEGGKIMLKDKRFCTVQEPDPNVSNGKLNCATVKELLSGTTITARKIFKQAESFQPNVIITFQTNVLLGYTENTEAIRRRITVVYYRACFKTRILGESHDNLEFDYDADPSLNTNITDNPKFWQAVFYSLLPYAQGLVRDGIKALSDIPRPSTIIHDTLNSFSRSNGLVGWLINNVKPCPGRAIRVDELKARILDANEQAIMNKKGAILDNSGKAKAGSTINNEILGQIALTYLGSIYRLQDKYYKKAKPHDMEREPVEEIDAPDYGKVSIIEYINNYERITGKKYLSRETVNNDIRRKFFQRYAVKVLDDSLNTSKTDLYVLGYAFVQDLHAMEEEEENGETNENDADEAGDFM